LEIRLDTNVKLLFERVHSNLLNVQLWVPGTDRYGHGWLLRGSKLLADEDLQRFLDGLTTCQEEPEPPLPPAA
jgi:hypothetical protein